MVDGGVGRRVDISDYRSDRKEIQYRWNGKPEWDYVFSIGARDHRSFWSATTMLKMNENIVEK